MRRTWYVGVAMVLCLAGAGANPAGAGTTADTMKPTLFAPLTAQVVLGSQVGADDYYSVDGEDRLVAETEMVASWHAEDASGICGYRIGYGNNNEGYVMPRRWGTQQVAARTVLANFRNQYSPHGYKVQVRDCAGNKRSARISFDVRLAQETAGRYTGNWGVSRCACWSGGTTKQTSQAGARVDFTVGPFPVGLVMETAPDRGKVQILVNGELRAVVDTYSNVKVHRTVVWVGTLPAGATLSVVNLATPGRARIDVDALLLPECCGGG